MEQNNRKTLTAKVIGKNTPKTLKVRVERKQQHPLYGKVVRTHKNYLAHCSDELYAEINVGDAVEISPTRPISSSKNWEVVGKANNTN